VFSILKSFLNEGWILANYFIAFVKRLFHSKIKILSLYITLMLL